MLEQTGDLARALGRAAEGPGADAGTGRRAPRGPRLPPRPGRQPRQGRRTCSRRPATWPGRWSSSGRARSCVGRWPPSTPLSPTTAADWPSAITGSAPCSRRPATWPGRWPSTGRIRSCARALAADHPEVPDYRRELAVGHNRVGGLLEKTGDLAGALAEQRKVPGAVPGAGRRAPRCPRLPPQPGRQPQIGSAACSSRPATWPVRWPSSGKCQELLRALAAEHPAVPDYRRDLAVSHIRVGNLLITAGRPVEALAELERARSLARGAGPSRSERRPTIAMLWPSH